jgi:carboxyl-terminal processing protease
MLHKGKLLVFLGSALIVLYGISAAYYGRVVAKDEAYKEISVFMDVLKKIYEDYVEVPDMNKVQEGAMRGLIEALDPYCSFLSKDQYESLQKRKVSGTAGLGMVISKRSEVLYVVSCEPGGPADQAGMRPGDYLVAVDGREVEDKSVLEVDSMLHGPADTKIKVTLFRSTRTKPLDLDLVLKPETPVKITSKMLDGDIGLLNVFSLTDSSIEQIRVKIKTLISAGARNLILDLRDCADGTPANGAELANFFLKDGTIY